MTADLSFAGSTVPDAFVGVPYLAGIPVYGGTVSNGITVCSVEAGTLPPGVSVAGSTEPYLTGTVAVASDTATQIDGAYSFTIVAADSAGAVSHAFTVNVHYLTADQDLSTTAQAAIRAGEAVDVPSNLVEDVGATGTYFPTAPVIPTDVG